MTTTEAAFYDTDVASEGRSDALLPLYREAARWIPHNHDVVDLGCGSGAFLGLLAYWGHTGALTGLDFSPAAIAERADGHTATLEVADLREWQPDPRRAGNTTYTALEVLEHLADDRELVKRIPPGHQFVFSVPNFESEAHLRVFRNAAAVWSRYDDLLNFRRWSLIRLDDRKAIHCMDTVRRQDSW